MKTSLLAVFVLLFAGYESSKTTATVSAEQAGRISVQLANDKADALYHHRPFKESQPARFEAGRWIWKDSHGVGMLDFQAIVELAANGSTNGVDIRVLDDSLRPQRIEPIR